MHPREIAFKLTHHRSNSSTTSSSTSSSVRRRRNRSTDQVGWEETEASIKMSTAAATQVKQVVKDKTRSIVDAPTYDRLLHSTDADRSVDLWTHSQIQLGKLLGEGSFNRVYQIGALNGDKNGDDYVVKVLRQELLSDVYEFALCAADIIKEAILMAAFDHPNILQARGVPAHGIAGFDVSHRNDAFFMVMGRLKESLDDRIRRWKIQSLRDAIRIHKRRTKREAHFVERLQVGIDLARAVDYLHSYNILHRDLKPTNIGFDPNGTLKVFDFDMARIVPEAPGIPDATFLLTQKAGSLRYISPENYKGQPYNLKSDVYSFSVLLHQILSLREPYRYSDSRILESKVFYQEERPKIPASWPESLQEILQRGWAHKLQERPTIQQVLSGLEGLQE